jgi:hypothetical protein
VVKPLKTGRLISVDKKPKRNTLASVSTRPAIKATAAEIAIASSVDAGRMLARLVPIITEVMAIVPTDCTELLPNHA